MPLNPGTRLGSYEIVSLLGAGGMGEVYKAKDLKLGRDVAIKVLREDLASDPERLRRFEQDARAASSLNHPNIVTISLFVPKLLSRCRTPLALCRGVLVA